MRVNKLYWLSILIFSLGALGTTFALRSTYPLFMNQPRSNSNNYSNLELLDTAARNKKQTILHTPTTANQKKKTVYETNDTQNMSALDIKLWHMIQQLAPDTKTARKIKKFEVYYDNESTVLASTQSLGGDNDGWLFSLNYKSLDDFSKLISTIIHEYAHIIGLSKSQMIEPVAYETCSNYYVSEGCLKPNSYLNMFYRQFWKDQKTQDPSKNYNDHPGNFVTSYAATSPIEDFAESFVYFVILEPPSDDTLARRKVQFFSQQLDLAHSRKTIRDQLEHWANL